MVWVEVDTVLWLSLSLDGVKDLWFYAGVMTLVVANSPSQVCMATSGNPEGCAVLILEFVPVKVWIEY